MFLLPCIVTLLLCCTLVQCLFLIPHNVLHVILANDESMEEFFIAFNVSTYFVVGIIVPDLNSEAYIPLHFGGIVDSLLSIPNPLFILYQPDPGNYLGTTLSNFVSKLPDATVVIAMQHGFHRLEIPFLEYMVNANEVKPMIIYHLNHEKPWEDKMSLDYTYSTVEELQRGYATQRLVVRHYYYKPLLSHSLYLPVGAPFSSRTVRNETSPLYLARHKFPLHDRDILCFFKGRLWYNSTFEYDKSDERQQLFNLKYKEGKLQRCIIEEYLKEDAMGANELSVDPYLFKLTKVVFLLCPSGNNPETFRMYEALETGAIPVMVKIQDEDLNFLNHEVWEGYPGPVLDDWSQLDSFLDSFSNPAMLYQLHTKLIAWYDRFWPSVQRYVHNHLCQTLDLAIPFVQTEHLYTSDALKAHIASASPDGTSSILTEGQEKSKSVNNVIETLLRRVESLEAKVAYLERELNIVKG